MAINPGKQNIKVNEDHGVATISILGDIGSTFFGDGYTMQDVKRDLSNITSKKINVDISTLGGGLFEALAIHDLIKEKDAEVTTRIMGATASAGTIIAQSASKGKALISKNAMHLVHPVIDMIIGNAKELHKAAEENTKFDGLLVDLYSNRIGDKKTKDQIKAQMDKEEFINAEDTVEFGFADEVFTPGSENTLIDKYDCSKINACNFLPNISKEEDKKDKSKDNGLMKKFNSIKDTLLNAIKELKEKNNSVDPPGEPAKSNPEITEKINALAVQINDVIRANEQGIEKFNQLQSDYDSMFKDYSKLAVSHGGKTGIEEIDKQIETNDSKLSPNEQAAEDNAKILRESTI